jgi:hypothetical protein
VNITAEEIRKAVEILRSAEKNRKCDDCHKNKPNDGLYLVQSGFAKKLCSECLKNYELLEVTK